MCICYFIWALNLILSVVTKIYHIIGSYEMYIKCKDALEYLKVMHTVRYKLYFMGTKEEVEEYSAEIERCGTILLNICENSISNNLLTKKHIKKVEEILNQTKNLMTTVH